MIKYCLYCHKPLPDGSKRKYCTDHCMIQHNAQKHKKPHQAPRSYPPNFDRIQANIEAIVKKVQQEQ